MAETTSFTLLHTNDVHGRIEGLARAATLVERIAGEDPQTPVLYVDAGDVEEHTNRLSSATKGAAMHRLLSAANCRAHAVGNATILRYGAESLVEQAREARYPLLLANMRQPDGSPLPGVQPIALINIGGRRLGLIGITSPVDGSYEKWYGLTFLPTAPLVRELAAQLRSEGADGVLLLSHMGLNEDRRLAEELQGVIPAIVGAHSHTLLPDGERIGSVLIAQAGQYAEHLGRVDCEWAPSGLVARRATVLPITDEVAPSPRVMAAAASAERDLEAFLGAIIGELAQPLDFAYDRECGVGDLTADALRERMGADVAVLAIGHAFSGPLPAGPLARGTLWEVCASPANPGVTILTGAQLLKMVRRGLDPTHAGHVSRVTRGTPQGIFHLSGASVRAGRLYVGDVPLDPQSTYHIAGTDWELDSEIPSVDASAGGYTDPAWGNTVRYDIPVIVREALEDYLARHHPAVVQLGRVDGALAE